MLIRNSQKIILLLTALLLTGCGSFPDLSFGEMSSAPETRSEYADTAGTEPDLQASASEAAAETTAAQENETAAAEIDPYAEDITPVNSYAYSRLSATEQQVYREVYRGLLDAKDTKLSTLNDDVLKKVYKYVLFDHPEIFYTDGFHYSSESIGDTRISLSFLPQYTLNDEEREQKAALLESAINAALSQAPDGSDYEKAIFAYDWVVENTDYREDAASGQNVLSVFLDGQSVCSGYAKAFQLLLQRMGIPAVLVTGTAKNGNHAWVAACPEGSWTLFDPTWGEPGLSDTELPAEDSFVNHAYFGLTTEELAADHTPLGDLSVPDCTDDSLNFFRQSGSYFTSCDMETLRELFRAAQKNDETALQFRCDSSALREEFLHELLDNQMVYRFLNGRTRASYFVNEGLNVVTFLMKS